MPRIAKNQLTIEPAGEGKFSLSGYVLVANKVGIFERTRIRQVGADLLALETEKLRLESEAKGYEQKLKAIAGVQQTWLTADQLRDAEAAYRRLPPGRTLFEAVEASDSVLGSGEPISCADALTAWTKNMEARRLESATRKDNENRTKRFLDACKATMVSDISARKTEDYVRRPGIAPLTALGDARVLSTFGNFCVREKYLKRSFVQFDLQELRERSKPQKEPDILTPEQSKALLNAALNANGGALVLFTIFSLWCFMRKSEVMRLRTDHLRMTKDANGVVTGINIHHRGRKLGSRWRTIPVPAALVPLVMACIDRKDLGPEVKKDGKVTDEGAVPFSEWQWRLIRAEAGLLTLKTNANDPRPVIDESSWCANLLRHTGMSYRFQESGDIQLVTNQAGNSEQIAYTHYLRDAEVDAYKKFYAITGTLPENDVAQESAQAVA